MLTDDFRKSLMDLAEKNPSAAIEEIRKNPDILKLLLNSDKQVAEERTEKIKYVNMTYEMQRQLEQKARELNTTKGLLLGGALLVFLASLDKK